MITIQTKQMSDHDNIGDAFAIQQLTLQEPLKILSVDVKTVPIIWIGEGV